MGKFGQIVLMIAGVVVILGAVWIALSLVGCAHSQVFPTSCRPGDQVRDAERRVYGVNDCYSCDEGTPGTVNAAGHYLCRDYTCNSDGCEEPPVNFGEKRRRSLDGGMPSGHDAP